MKAEVIGLTLNVRAFCPDCKAIAVFNRNESLLTINIRDLRASTWALMKCAGCGRGALALYQKIDRMPPSASTEDQLMDFHPRFIPTTTLPEAVPEGIKKEYREAELCAGNGAWRAASVLLRSTLEKALKANGYTEGSLYAKIEKAAGDGVITDARKAKAHEEVRVLGNEIVHEEWRPVDPTDVEASLHYTQRVLEDLYDDPATVSEVLKSKRGVQGIA